MSLRTLMSYSVLYLAMVKNPLINSATVKNFLMNFGVQWYQDHLRGGPSHGNTPFCVKK